MATTDPSIINEARRKLKSANFADAEIDAYIQMKFGQTTLPTQTLSTAGKDIEQQTLPTGQIQAGVPTPSIPTPETQPIQPFKPSPLATGIEFASNIGKSSLQFGKDIVQPVLHPIQTAKSIKDLAIGTAQLLVPGEQEQEQLAKQLGSFYAERYGDLDSIKEAAFEDPIGVVGDAATFLTGAGAAIGGAAKVAKVGKFGRLARVGEEAAKLGRQIDPGTLAAKGLSKATRSVGALGAEALGITTGAGAGAIREAFTNPSPQFRQALRGQINPTNIVAQAREGLSVLRDKRAANYQKRLQKIENINKQLDITPVINKIDEQLKRFRIERNPDGTLNIKNSTIANKAEANRVIEAIETIERWGDNPENLKPIQIDTLKRRLDDFYSDSGEARALITALSSQVRDVLVKNVPEYAEMTRQYAKESKLINNIQETLSLGKKAKTETTIKKLTSALKSNQEFRQEMVRRLQEASNADLTGQIAGTALSAPLPENLFRVGAVGGAGVVGGVGFNPALFGLLATTSPRAAGEFVRALGLPKRATQTIIESIRSTRVGKTATRVGTAITSPTARQAAFQVGRGTRVAQPQQLQPAIEQLEQQQLRQR